MCISFVNVFYRINSVLMIFDNYFGCKLVLVVVILSYKWIGEKNVCRWGIIDINK